MRLSQTRDDVAGTLRIQCGGLRFFGLDGPAGARKDAAPGLQRPAAQLTQAGDETRRVEYFRDLLTPGKCIQARLEIRHKGCRLRLANEFGKHIGKNALGMTDRVSLTKDQVFVVPVSRCALGTVSRTVDRYGQQGPEQAVRCRSLRLPEHGPNLRPGIVTQLVVAADDEVRIVVADLERRRYAATKRSAFQPETQANRHPLHAGDARRRRSADDVWRIDGARAC